MFVISYADFYNQVLVDFLPLQDLSPVKKGWLIIDQRFSLSSRPGLRVGKTLLQGQIVDGKLGGKGCPPKRKGLGWLPNPLIFPNGGDDETRTRDLRRDRPAF